MEKREYRCSPTTRVVRRRESRIKYESSRQARSNIKIAKDLFDKWCCVRDERKESNDEFVSHLLAMYEEETKTSDRESTPERALMPEPALTPQPVLTAGAQEDNFMRRVAIMESSPGRNEAQVEVLLDSASDAQSLPSSVHSDSSQPQGVHEKSSSVVQTEQHQSGLDGDNADLHDISVSFVEEGDFVFLHEKEDCDSNVSEFDAEVYLQRGAEGTSNLPKVGEDDNILGVHEEEEEDHSQERRTRSGLHIKLSPDQAAELDFFMISRSRLQQLASSHRCQTCGELAAPTVSAANGTAAHVSWVCPNDHKEHFCTQEVVGRTHAGDVRMASAIILSGNNFQKVKLLAKFARLNMMSQGTFYKVQGNYVIPAIENHWEEIQKATVTKHSTSPVVVCGDARNDSPGHSAQYCTYTFMESRTNDILHVEFVDKRQTALRSPNMEMKAFKDGIVAMEEAGLAVTEVVTDAHPSIAKYMRENKPDMKHSWDVWHGSKNLAKKITKAGSRASTRGLLFWVKHIIRHFWHCSKTCEGNVADFKAKWHGVTHHVTNQHSWVAGFGGAAQCDHGELEERQEWLTRGGDAHRAMVQVCFEKRFLGNLNHYVNYRHTSILESLHNHILMYASKRFAFKYPAYRARNLLAMIDFMAHKDRPDQTNEDGTTKYEAVWSKHAGDYVAVRVKVAKSYLYIESLMKDIFVRKAADEAPMFRRSTIMPGDPRLLQARLAPFPPPPIDVILARRTGPRAEESEVD